MAKYVGLLLIVLAFVVSTEAKQKKTPEKPVTPPGQRSAANAHSFMELFTKLEADVSSATERQDRNALESLLAPEFILRRASDPDHPTTRADWLGNLASQSPVKAGTQRSMAIRAFANEAIVSYVAVPGPDSGSGGHNPASDFVVDLWVVNHGTWQLAARNAARICQE